MHCRTRYAPSQLPQVTPGLPYTPLTAQKANNLEQWYRDMTAAVGRLPPRIVGVAQRKANTD